MFSPFPLWLSMTVIIRALLSNLETFSRLVGQDKVQPDRIKKFEEECEELRNTIKELKDRLADLEEKHKPGNSHYLSDK